MLQSKLKLFPYLADMGEARGYSTNMSMINSETKSSFSFHSFTASSHPNGYR